MKFLCPNCGSIKSNNKHSIGKKFLSGPYKNVNSEVQCSLCFMDIPSNLCENISEHLVQSSKKLWIEKYKPEHIKHAAKCSKCYRSYWEIEKYLFDNNVTKKDIFYQIYNSQKGVGDLVCKICDPTAFQ